MLGQNLAEEFLRGRGLVLLDNNWRAGKLGEIDLIMQYRGQIVFVEVKTRQSRYLNPTEVLSVHKQRKLVSLSRLWLYHHKLDEYVCPWRLDLVYVDMGRHSCLWYKRII